MKVNIFLNGIIFCSKNVEIYIQDVYDTYTEKNKLLIEFKKNNVRIQGFTITCENDDEIFFLKKELFLLIQSSKGCIDITNEHIKKYKEYYLKGYK